ncbi:sterol desaturase family protein, partial [Nocardia farcinica]|uniref:sterol desaturase family protein n=1 Tax=Nocardia farcinica TaxID=37329 RepID=UPI003980ED93
MSTLISALVRFGYAPLMLLGINGAGVALAAAGANKLWLLALLGIAVAVSFTAEALLPYRADWNTSHGDTGRDTAHGFVNETLILGSVAAIPALAALIPGDGIWPGSWPFIVQVLIAILVADFGITLAHYASHKIAILWRFHAVHHSVQRFYEVPELPRTVTQSMIWVTERSCLWHRKSRVSSAPSSGKQRHVR